MTEPTPEGGRDAGPPDRGSTANGMPRWVKVSLIVAAVLVLVFFILNLTGIDPGDHGPSRHQPGGGAPPAGDMEHAPPRGVDHGM